MAGITVPTQAAVELPRYRCHKEVEALKIKQIEIREPQDPMHSDQEVWIIPADEDQEAFKVEWEFVNRFKPEAGMYWVKSAEGHEGALPAELFDKEFSRL